MNRVSHRRFGHSASSEVVGEYHTRTGKVGARIVKRTIGGRTHYGWSGEWGAGSVGEADMLREVASWHERKRGMKVIVEFVP